MELQTERLILRDFIEEDWQVLYRYRSDDRFTRYSPWDIRSASDTREMVKEFISWSDEIPRYRYQLAIVLKEDSSLLGSCGIIQDSPDTLQAELGYELAPERQGSGYAQEAARAVLKFAFERQQLHRVCARCLSENHPSVSLLERLGFRQEGCLRENIWMEGRWWDTLIYSLLVYEWQAANQG